ncbi:hypothetical protein MBLNU457_7723t1 [Dothideomycetes sp. NU457]
MEGRPIEFIYYNEHDGLYVFREIRDGALPCTILDNRIQTPALGAQLTFKRVSTTKTEEVCAGPIVKRIPDQVSSPLDDDWELDMDLVNHTIITACLSSLATWAILYVAPCLDSQAQLTTATFFVLIALYFTPHWRLEAFVDANPELTELLFISAIMCLGA